MTDERKQKIRERLAAIEHERWADWQLWVHDQGRRLDDGDLIIPAVLVERWERQIATPYDQLSKAEQRADMDQVDRYWPIIDAELAAAREREKGLREALGVAYHLLVWEWNGEENAPGIAKFLERMKRGDWHGLIDIDAALAEEGRDD